MQLQSQLLENRNNELAEINNLTNEIEEIHDIFIDMSHLVNEQGETLENIQTNIESTQHSTAGANTELIKATKYKRKTRRCMCRLISITTSALFSLALISYLLNIGQ